VLALLVLPVRRTCAPDDDDMRILYQMAGRVKAGKADPAHAAKPRSLAVIPAKAGFQPSA